ncbi:MAG: response regulator [Rhodospirillales bacterium]|nr:response regulator [Rhodospirillales bacterium]MBO6788667.1 response regulator [Rhodospirillales bacterium]
MSDQSEPNKQSRAIIVDDSELMRRVVIAALTALDCEVVGEADDGDAGIALYKDASPDLVLLDIRMPIMDGLTTLKKLQEIDPGAYVVMMTAVEDEESIEDAMIGGAKDYLRKSMAMNEMINRLERHVNRTKT